MEAAEPDPRLAHRMMHNNDWGGPKDARNLHHHHNMMQDPRHLQQPLQSSTTYKAPPPPAGSIPASTPQQQTTILPPHNRTPAGHMQPQTQLTQQQVQELIRLKNTLNYDGMLLAKHQQEQQLKLYLHQQQQQYKNSAPSGMMTSNSGYRPPVAPKPAMVNASVPSAVFEGSYINMNQQQDNVDMSSMLINHSKSDSVDSSDGLRSSSVTRRNNGRNSIHQNNADVYFDNKDLNVRHSSSITPRNVDIHNNDRSNRNTPISNSGSISSNNSYARIQKVIEDRTAPTPPPRQYKLINARDQQGITTPILVQSSDAISHAVRQSSGGGAVHNVPNTPTTQGSSARSQLTRHGSHMVLRGAPSITSAPGSRYGSSSSINNMDYSPGDYRAHLSSSYRATLGDSLDPEDYSSGEHYGSQILRQPSIRKHNNSIVSARSRSNRNSFASENGVCDIQDLLERSNSRYGSIRGERSDGAMSIKRTPSIASVRCDSPGGRSISSVTSRASMSSAKNALLKEKIFGNRCIPASDQRGMESSASPILSRKDIRDNDSDIGSRLAMQPPVPANRNDQHLTKSQRSYAKSNRSARSSRRSSPTPTESEQFQVNMEDIIRKTIPDLSPSKVSMMVNALNTASFNDDQLPRSKTLEKGNSSQNPTNSLRSAKTSNALRQIRSGSEEPPNFNSNSADNYSLQRSASTDKANRSLANHAHHMEVRDPLAPPPSATSLRSVSNYMYNTGTENILINKISPIVESTTLGFTNVVRKSNMEPGSPTISDRTSGNRDSKIKSQQKSLKETGSLLDEQQIIRHSAISRKESSPLYDTAVYNSNQKKLATTNYIRKESTPLSYEANKAPVAPLLLDNRSLSAGGAHPQRGTRLTPPAMDVIETMSHTAGTPIPQTSRLIDVIVGSNETLLVTAKDDINTSTEDAVDSGIGGIRAASRCGGSGAGGSSSAVPIGTGGDVMELFKPHIDINDIITSASPTIEQSTTLNPSNDNHNNNHNETNQEDSPDSTNGFRTSFKESNPTSSFTASATAIDAPEIDNAGSVADTSSKSLPRNMESQNSNIKDRTYCYPKLNRGLSKTSENGGLVCKARNELTQGIWDALGGRRRDDANIAGAAAAGGRDGGGGEVVGCVVETPPHTFMLPDLSVYEGSFRTFVERDLIEVSTLHSLESCGRLNWWAGPCQRLWPLATTGDGNCLLHAASLGMWGFHDRLLVLRSALHEFLTNSPYTSSLWRRWRWHTALANADTGLVYTDQEWDNEWKNVLRLASTAPRNNNHNNNDVIINGDSNNKSANATEPSHPQNAHKSYRTLSESLPPSSSFVDREFVARAAAAANVGADICDETVLLRNSNRDSGASTSGGGGGGLGSKRLSNGLQSPGGSSSSSNGAAETASSGAVYESLEELHILALAHVLRRPIIVVADVTLKDVHGAPLSPIPFGGVYLPLEFPPQECQRSPLLLTYDAAHFSALVVMEEPDVLESVPAVIPVTSSQHNLLTLHFSVDPGEHYDWNSSSGGDEEIHHNNTDLSKRQLLEQYLDIVQVPISPNFSDYHERQNDPSNERCYSPNYPDGDKPNSPDSSGESDDPLCTCDEYNNLARTNKSSHSKQCPRQSSKQHNALGTLGRTMSKRIKSLKKIGRPGSFRRKDGAGSQEYGSGSSKSNRLGTSSSFRSRNSSLRRPASHQNYILAATIHTEKRMAFQEEMVKNYLASARKRFLEEKDNKKRKEEAAAASSSLMRQGEKNPKGSAAVESTIQSSPLDANMPSECINIGCTMFGTANTSYMCTTCYAKQRQEEIELIRRINPHQQPAISNSETSKTVGSKGAGRGNMTSDNSKSEFYDEGKGSSAVDSALSSYDTGSLARGRTMDGPQYGAGKSQFYAELDNDSVQRASTIPTARQPNSKQDSTLFLSNSTFYDTTNTSKLPPNSKYLSSNGRNGNKVAGTTTSDSFRSKNPQKTTHRNNSGGNNDYDCESRRPSSSSGSDPSDTCNNQNVSDNKTKITNSSANLCEPSKVHLTTHSPSLTSKELADDPGRCITPISVNNVHLPITSSDVSNKSNGCNKKGGSFGNKSSSMSVSNSGVESKSPQNSRSSMLLRNSLKLRKGNNNSSKDAASVITLVKTRRKSLVQQQGVEPDNEWEGPSSEWEGSDRGREEQRQCLKSGCEFYGSKLYSGYCSKCDANRKNKN